MTINPWIKTSIIATVGGGIAGAFAAAMDPSKYRFPHDFGSGKLWEFFFEGAVTVGAATLIKSPFGQGVLAAFKDSQKQLKEGKDDIAKTKADIKATTTDSK